MNSRVDLARRLHAVAAVWSQAQADGMAALGASGLRTWLERGAEEYVMRDRACEAVSPRRLPRLEQAMWERRHRRRNTARVLRLFRRRR